MTVTVSLVFLLLSAGISLGTAVAAFHLLPGQKAFRVQYMRLGRLNALVEVLAESKKLANQAPEASRLHVQAHVLRVLDILNSRSS